MPRSVSSPNGRHSWSVPAMKSELPSEPASCSSSCLTAETPSVTLILRRCRRAARRAQQLGPDGRPRGDSPGRTVFWPRTRTRDGEGRRFEHLDGRSSRTSRAAAREVVSCRTRQNHRGADDALAGLPRSRCLARDARPCPSRAKSVVKGHASRVTAMLRFCNHLVIQAKLREGCGTNDWN